MIGFNSGAGHFLRFVVTLILVVQVAEGIVMSVGAVVSNEDSGLVSVVIFILYYHD